MIIKNKVLKQIMTPLNNISYVTPEDADDINKIEASNKYTIYDIYPINDDRIYRYYNSKTNQIERINYDDTIKVESDINNILMKFSNKSFLFVTNDSKIIGITTLSDLNNKYISLYLYSIFIELENELCNYIKKHISDDELLHILENNNAENCKDLLKRYKNDLHKNFDASIFEYLYFSNLMNIIKQQELFYELCIQSKSELKKYNSLIDLRNRIMHPVRSLINSIADIEKLNDDLLKMSKLIYNIKNRCV